MLGLEIPIDWPAPPMRERGLAIDTYLPLDPYLPDGNRWLNGVKWTPYGCADATARRVDLECDETDLIFSIPTPFDAFTTFHAFRIESAFECSTLGGMGINGEKLYQHALDVTRQDRSRLLARQVALGNPETPNPDLTDQADMVSVPVDTTPIEALAAIENELAVRLNNARGMIHVDPGMLVLLNSGGGLLFVGNEIQTPTGNVVVADAGYIGTAPQAGRSRLFGSGMVYFTSTPLVPVSSSWENFDWANNIVEAQVEQYFLAVFETCPVVGAEVIL